MRETQLARRQAISVLIEYLNLRIASIDDAITNAACGSSGRAWHTAVSLGPSSSGRERKMSAFLFLSSLKVSRSTPKPESPDGRVQPLVGWHRFETAPNCTPGTAYR